MAHLPVPPVSCSEEEGTRPGGFCWLTCLGLGREAPGCHAPVGCSFAPKNVVCRFTNTEMPQKHTSRSSPDPGHTAAPCPEDVLAFVTPLIPNQLKPKE